LGFRITVLNELGKLTQSGHEFASDTGAAGEQLLIFVFEPG